MRGASRLETAILTAVKRGQVVLSKLTPKRTLVQLRALANDSFNSIELLLPYGMSALPKGGNVIILRIAGNADHKVALCADDPACRIADLQDGEFGFRDDLGQMVVFRRDRIQIVTPKDLDANVGGNVNAAIGGKFTGSASEWDLTGDLNVTGRITASGDITDNSGTNAATVKALRDAHNDHHHPPSSLPDITV